MMWWRLLVGLQQGHTLARLLMNEQLRHYSVSGIIVDLGAGKQPASYLKLVTRPGSDVVSVDRDTGRQPTLVADIQQGIPLSGDSVDAVLCMNLLEHTWQYEAIIQEAQRILKPGGVLIGAVPFLYPIHPFPNRIYNDCFRFTDTTLHHLLKDAGFTAIAIQPTGIGPTTAGLFFAELPWIRILKWIPLFRFLLYLGASAVDTIAYLTFQRLIYHTTEHPFVLGYVFTGRKQ